MAVHKLKWVDGVPTLGEKVAESMAEHDAVIRRELGDQANDPEVIWRNPDAPQATAVGGRTQPGPPAQPGPVQ